MDKRPNRTQIFVSTEIHDQLKRLRRKIKNKNKGYRFETYEDVIKRLIRH